MHFVQQLQQQHRQQQQEQYHQLRKAPKGIISISTLYKHATVATLTGKFACASRLQLSVGTLK